MDKESWLRRRAGGTTEFGVMQLTNGLSPVCVEEKHEFTGQSCPVLAYS